MTICNNLLKNNIIKKTPKSIENTLQIYRSVFQNLRMICIFKEKERAIILLCWLQNVSPQGNEGFIIQTRFRRLMRKEGPLPANSIIQLFYILKKRRNEILLNRCLLLERAPIPGSHVTIAIVCTESGNWFVCA